MKNELKGDIKRYQRRIRSNLLCSTKLSKQFMTDLACAIDSFIEENGVTQLAEVEDHFGTPEQIARSFLATTDIAAIRKKMRLKRIISGLLLTLLLIWGIFVVCEFLRSYETRSGYGIDREVVIISRAEDEATATDATTTNTDD